MASVLTVNSAYVGPDGVTPKTGIDKRPCDGALPVRAPGPMRGGLGSGIVGDVIGNRKLHGGDDQAVYAYAREDLDAWAAQLNRELTNGMFGENITTDGMDVSGVRQTAGYRRLDQDFHPRRFTRCVPARDRTGIDVRR